jgi:septal ring-binding cell division protein DamX
MTPPAAAAAPRTRTRRTAAPARRVSGPATGRTRVAHPHLPAAPPLALRIGGAVGTLAEHRFLDRLVRGRAWIAILGVGLIGIVFMQVSMLRMNAGIGRDVNTASKLDRENAALRATISEESSGNHIEALAARMGLVLPPGTPRFLDARRFDAGRAANAITAPGDFPSGVTGTQVDATAASPLAPTGVAPSTGTAVSTTAPATATGTTAAAPATATTTAPAPTTSSSTATTAPATATASPQPNATSPPASTGGAAPTPTGR